MGSIPAKLLQTIEKTSYICVLTGAGISAESGIATFRGQNGLWSKYRPEDLANEQAFCANPDYVWRWYQSRRETVASAQPNPGHLALVRIEAVANRFTLVTQNVDGLHQAAGSKNVIELHGNIRINRCMQCGSESSMDEATYQGKVPLCPCGGILRPGVVWFGENLPETAIIRSIQAAQECDLFMTVGTSALVYPAASLPEMALRRNIPVVEINPEETPFSRFATFSIRSNAGGILPQIAEALEIAHASSLRRAREL
jgi:NAD-dependent deacetylase